MLKRLYGQEQDNEEDKQNYSDALLLVSATEKSAKESFKEKLEKRQEFKFDYFRYWLVN